MQLCRVPLNELAGGCCNNGSINAQVHTYGVIESDVTVTELGSQRESCIYDCMQLPLDQKQGHYCAIH